MGTLLNGIRSRGVPLAALICLAILLGVAVLVSAVNERAMKHELAREAEAQADLLASAVSGALAFDDRAAAKDYVDAVQVNPSVLAAGVYDETHHLVASYARAGEAMPRVVEPARPSTTFRDGRLYVEREVREGGQLLGCVRLSLMDAPASQRFSRYAGMLLVLALAALLIAVLTLTQGALRRANRALTARAGDLAQANDRLQEQMVERERAEEALRQSQKMEAIGRLTGGVAHDFNNLLMVISSAIELMNRTDDPRRRRSLMDGMRQAVDRGAGLTRQLLAFSRETPVRTAVIDVGDQVEGMAILLDRSLREDIAVTIDVQRPLKPVEVDVGELELAILNLAVNARDAMPEGGRLMISARPDGEDHVCVEVADTGPGIAPDVIERIFEPFFTTKEVGKGTGLGLSQVYGFARSSGGEVMARSPVGLGAVFTLRLPVTDKAARQIPAPVAPASAAGEGRVLLVEDDDGVASGVGEMLAELGYRHERARNGEEALEMFRDDPAFDLVLSDMVMPGAVGGLALATELREARPDLPMVLSTGYSEAAATAGQAGLTVLSKPYGLQELAATLAAALDHPT